MQWLISAVMSSWLGIHVADLSKGGADAGVNPPGIGPTPPRVFDLGWAGLSDVHITSDQLAVFGVAALVALALYVVIRRTRVGLEMRSQVDRPVLAGLRGIDPNRTSGIAWMLSCALAGLGGVLIAPLFQLDSNTFTFVVFGSLAAVAVAGLRSIPIAFAAGLGLGVLQDLVAGYLPSFLSNLSGFEDSIPYLALIIALLVMGRQRGRAAGSVSDEKPARITGWGYRRGGADCHGRSVPCCWSSTRSVYCRGRPTPPSFSVASWRQAWRWRSCSCPLSSSPGSVAWSVWLKPRS